LASIHFRQGNGNFGDIILNSNPNRLAQLLVDRRLPAFAGRAEAVDQVGVEAQCYLCPSNNLGNLVLMRSTRSGSMKR
jgi:hypothetical protein